ncbi:MAG: hypothetical protein DME23_23390 [Verrucomicrobia bacterium]|nr:MAG: hypothetical protein DME23_23390 [Verrucomicrobiota bacterium]
MNGAVTTGDELLVPGPAVRREYLKLPGDLAHLTGSFGITLPPQLHRHAAALAFSIECTDRLLDAIPQAQRRARFSADVVSCLRGEKFSNEDITPELAGWLARLSEVAERHGVSVRFREIIRELLSNSEEMRTTRNHARFVDCAVREGRWMVELLLLLLAKVSSPQFDSFMRQLSEPANLADKLRDARRDFLRGEIAVRPTVSFRARLLCEMLWRVVRLVRVSGVNGRLVVWGVHSLFIELIWFRFSTSHSR